MASSQSWFLEQARLGNMYACCTTGAVTLSTVSATCTGLVLSNAPNTGMNLVLYSAAFQPSTAPAGVGLVGLAISPAVSNTEVTHTTPAVIHNCLSRGSNINEGVGKADAAATLPAAPVWRYPLAGVTATASITPTKYETIFEGTIILPPGTNISFSYLTTAVLGIAAFTWAEIPV